MCRIIEQVKNTQAYPFIPSQYMCTITFVWIEDLVIAPSRISYDRKGLERWINIHHSDPYTRPISWVYMNKNLKDVIEHYRNYFLHFSIPFTNYLVLSYILHSYHIAVYRIFYVLKAVFWYNVFIK